MGTCGCVQAGWAATSLPRRAHNLASGYAESRLKKPRTTKSARIGTAGWESGAGALSDKSGAIARPVGAVCRFAGALADSADSPPPPNDDDDDDAGTGGGRAAAGGGAYGRSDGPCPKGVGSAICFKATESGGCGAGVPITYSDVETAFASP